MLASSFPEQFIESFFGHWSHANMQNMRKHPSTQHQLQHAFSFHEDKSLKSLFNTQNDSYVVISIFKYARRSLKKRPIAILLPLSERNFQNRYYCLK